jgi:hypothetical protein
MEETRDRYVTFANIDCYKNAVDALDAMKALFEEYPQAYNSFWERFYEHIPENYADCYEKEGYKDILYYVCSNVFYISDLFEEYDFEQGIEVLDRAELECC